MIIVVTVKTNNQNSVAPKSKVGLVLAHINPYVHQLNFSKGFDSGIHTSRQEREEGFLHGRIIHCLQAKCTEEVFESHQSEPE